MLRIDPRQLSDLEWRRPSVFSRQYELKTGDSQIASLHFPSVFGTRAEAQTASESWNFRRTGILTKLVTARRSDSGAEVAQYQMAPFRFKGSLCLTSGETLELKPANFWKLEWNLIGSDGAPLIRMRYRGAFRRRCEVSLLGACREREDLGLLLTLAWYVLVLHRRDSAAHS